MSSITWTNYSFDEQDLTAYALGAAAEMDEKTRVAIEAELENDEALRDEVLAIENTAGTIQAVLAEAPSEMPALGTEAREAVISAAGTVEGSSAEDLGRANGWARRGFAQINQFIDWMMNGSAPQVASRLAIAGLAGWLVVLPTARWGTAWVMYPLKGVIAVTYVWVAEVSNPSRLEGLNDRSAIDDLENSAQREPRPLTDYLFRRGDVDSYGSVASGTGASAPSIDFVLGDESMSAEGDAPEDVAPLDAMADRRAVSAPPVAQAGAIQVVPSGSYTSEGRDPSSDQSITWDSDTRALSDRASEVDVLAPGLPSDFYERGNAEGYASVDDNPFQSAADAPLSTFSIDVDTASYSNVRRFISARRGGCHRASAVRIEEMINYFDYDYEPPSDNSETPFAVHVEIAEAPWRHEHRLVRIGLKGREIERDARPDSNLVFLIDVSGSMNAQNKLPLVQRSLGMLVEQLGPRDRVGIVTYAGVSGTALRSTPGDATRTIMNVVDALGAGGSTAGAAGIQGAYNLALEGFIEGGVNRVILLTDGDFNVGATNHDDLQRIIENEAKRGTFLTVLGYGMGNYKDDTLELLADKGNGNYAYVDSLRTRPESCWSSRSSGTLVTIAKDVKIQVEFNPAEVGAYRLIGYENRMLAAQDFNDDTKDAGEIGAGHTVTALYEVVPIGIPMDVPGIDPLRYGDGGTRESGASINPLGEDETLSASGPGELLFVKLRHKAPDASVSTRVEYPVFDNGRTLRQASDDFHFAAGVAAFGMLLRGSPYAGDVTFEDASELARSGKGRDEHGYRAELIELIQRADGMARR